MPPEPPLPSTTLAAGPSPGDLQALLDALRASGDAGPAGVSCADLVQALAITAPQAIVVHAAQQPPDLAPLFEAWGAEPPCALVVVCPDPGPEAAAHWAAAGVTAWLPRLEPERLPSVLAMARGRHAAERGLRRQLAEARERLDDRIWIERAKGLLMDARQLSEDQAFTLLRDAAMQSRLRLPEVARSIVDAARWAEAVNRAGQLRMLSQHLVGLAAQRLARVDGARTRQAQALRRAQDSIGFVCALGLPDGEAADALRGVQQAHEALKAVLAGRPDAAALPAIDARAERLLLAAEALTSALQALGTRPTLTVINLCGRQRMLSQRLAKEAQLARLLAPQAERDERMQALIGQFERAQAEIESAPLSSPEIRASLQAARDGWLHLVRTLRGGDAQALAQAGDHLLLHLDRLTEDCEHSLQLLLS